ncbi:unnamed protein product [Blepharisma stoltei]|uniref:Dynein heavy chain n=1 Tax=Blepharisma stoltei TaxID=1481888 RepID=A0AAU9J275_9CILI|nr:unnamed protein product [Blepharisma stoltei]
MESDLTPRAKEEHEHKAYSKLLEFEIKEWEQEKLREKLGKPFGRLPPFKLDILSRESPTFLRPDSNRAFSTDKLLIQEGSSTARYGHTYKAPKGLPPLSRDKSATIIPNFQLTFDKFYPVLEAVKTIGPDKKLSLPPSKRNRLGDDSPFFSQTPKEIEKIPESEQFQFGVPSDKNVLEFNPFVRPSGKNYFFPLEMFICEDLKFEEMDYPQDGFSRWRTKEGQTVWNECVVISYNQLAHKFAIQWKDKEGIKEVPRMNLMFAWENKEEFFKKLKEAENARVEHEAGVRYLGRLEIETNYEITNQRIKLPLKREKKILKRVGKVSNPVVLDDIMNEIREHYVRGIVQYSFDLEHFAKEMKRSEKPWLDHLKRQENVHDMVISETNYSRDHIYETQEKLLKLSEISPEEQKILLKIIGDMNTIKYMKFYHYLIEIDANERILPISDLEYQMKEGYKEVRIKIDAIAKRAQTKLEHFDDMPEKNYLLAEMLLESNLQVAVSDSIDQLMDYFKKYYTTVPLNTAGLDILSLLPERVYRIRVEARDKLNLYTAPVLKFFEYDDPIIHSINLARCCIKKLQESLYSNDGEFFSSDIKPLVSIEILSKSTLQKIKKGQGLKLYNIEFQHKTRDETFHRRSKRVNTQLSSQNIKRDSMHDPVRNLLASDEECKIDPDYIFETKGKPSSLMNNELCWLKVDCKSFNMVFSPSLEFIEEAFKDIVKVPLRAISTIRRIKRNRAWNDHISVNNANSEYSRFMSMAREALHYNFYGPVSLLAILRSYDYLVKMKVNQLFKFIVQEHIDDYAGLRNEMIRLNDDIDFFENKLPTVMKFGLLQVDLRLIKSELLHNSQELLKNLKLELEDEQIGILNEAYEKLDAIVAKLHCQPKTVEEFVEMQKYLEDNGDLKEFQRVEEDLNQVSYIMQTLDYFKHAGNPEYLMKWWETKSWNWKLQLGREEALKSLEKLFPMFRELVKQSVVALKEKLKVTKNSMAEFAALYDINQGDVYAAMAKEIILEIDEFSNESELINKREEVLGFAKSDFSEIQRMKDEFNKYYQLWSYVRLWNERCNSWMYHPFKFIKAGQVEETLRDGISLLNKLETEFTGNQILLGVVIEVQTKLSAFEKYLPFVLCLSDKSMLMRHWKQIWDLLGPLDVDMLDSARLESQTLQQLLEKKITSYLDKVTEISMIARHEHEIEQVLYTIDKDISARLNIEPVEDYPDILIATKVVENLCIIKEHHLTLTFLLKSSRYVDYFKSQIVENQHILSKLKYFLEDLNNFQNKWLDLYPLFSLPEISEAMRQETSEIKEINTMYQKRLEFLQSNSIGSTASEGQFKSIIEVNERLDAIREKLKRELKRKQETCARFSFIVFENLLAMLKQIILEKPVDLSLLFSGLIAAPTNSHSLSIISRKNCNVELIDSVTISIASRKVPIEKWVSDLERSLVKTFQAEFNKNIAEAFNNENWWMSVKDPQILKTVQIAKFSYEINDILFVQKRRPLLSNLREKYLALHNKVAEFVCPLHKENWKVNNTTLEGIFAIEEKAKKRKLFIQFSIDLLSYINVIDNLLGSSDDFHWISFIKYRLSGDFSKFPTNFQISVEILDFVQDFGYEYHDMERYIPTPLSDRTMLNIINTIHNGYSSILMGDSNAGKTTMLRQLAMICGKPLCILRCTESSTYKVIMNLLIGCAQGGYWGVLEEVNYLDISLISTMLFHLRDVHEKLQGKYNKVLIGERLIKINPGFSLFCTTSARNPKAPKSMYSSFRPLKLIEPNFTIVAEYTLAAYGIKNAKEYAQKITTTMKILETNFYSVTRPILSDTIFAFSTGVSGLQRLMQRIMDLADKDPRKDMNIIIAESIYKRYSKEMRDGLIDVLVEVLESVFKVDLEYHKENNGLEKHRNLFIEAMRDLNIVPSENLLIKCQTLWNLVINVKRRKWVIVSGPPCTGKTSILTVIAWAYALKKSRGFCIHKLSSDFTAKMLDRLVDFTTNPSIAPKHSMYCTFHISKYPMKTGYTSNDWIAIDSKDIDFEFALLNSMTKPIYFSSEGKKIPLSLDSKLIIEVEKLDKLTPHDLSDFSVFCTSSIDLDPKILYHNIASKIENSDKDFFEIQYEKVWLPLYNFVNSCEKLNFKLEYRIWIIQFLRLFQALMKDLSSDFVKNHSGTFNNPIQKKYSNQLSFKPNPNLSFSMDSSFDKSKNGKNMNYNPEEVDKTGEMMSNLLQYIAGLKSNENNPVAPALLWESLYINAIVYTLGSCLCEDDKEKFSQVLYGILENFNDAYAGGLKSRMLEGKGHSIFDYYFSTTTNQWMSWSDDTFSIQSELVPKSNFNNPSTSTQYHKQKTIKNEEIIREAIKPKKAQEALSLLNSNEIMMIYTKTSRKTLYWLNYCFQRKIHTFLYGHHQTGKTSIIQHLLHRQIESGYCGVLSIALTEKTIVGSVQHMISNSMDHIRDNFLRGPGGVKQFIVIDDLNLDVEGNIYEMMRFWNETGGWYDEQFLTVNDLVLLPVHGFGKIKRPLYQRALRNFVIVYKEPYSDAEIGSIFRETISVEAVSSSENSEEGEDMYSVMDLTVNSYIKLYEKLKGYFEELEKSWLNINLQKFMDCLRCIGKFRMVENLELTDFLKVWSYINKLYFVDQFWYIPENEEEDKKAGIISEIYDIIQDHYYGFLNEFEQDEDNIEEIEKSAILIDKSIISNGPSEYVSINQEIGALILNKFDEAIEKSKTTHSEELKHLCKCYFTPEKLLGKYINLYINILFDIQQRNPCEIVTTAHEAYVVRALAIAAGNTLGIPVFNMNKGQNSQELVTNDFENFGIGAHFPLPIEARYNFKKIIDRACLNKHSLITFTILDNNLNTSFIKGMLEIFNDIASASALKAGQCLKFIQEAIQKMKKDFPNLKFLLDEQLIQWVFEQIRTYTTIILIVETEQYLFTRAPNEPQGVLEKLKYFYLPLYKSSRLVCYNTLKAPYSILEALVIQEDFLNKWASDLDNSILSGFLARYQALTSDKEEAEYTVELFTYYTNKIHQKNLDTIEKKLEYLHKAIKKAEFLDHEVEHSHERITKIEDELSLQSARLQELEKTKHQLSLDLQFVESVGFLADFFVEYETKKDEFLEQYEQAKEDFEGLVESVVPEDYEELETLSAFPMPLMVLGMGLAMLTSSKINSFLHEKLESVAKPILIGFGKNYREAQKKLRRIKLETIPDLSEVLNHPAVRDFGGNRLQKSFKAIYRIIDTCQRYKTLSEQYDIKENEWAEAEKLLPIEKENLRAKEKAKIIESLSKLEPEREALKNQIQKLSKLIETINNQKPKAAVLTRAMKAHRMKWVHEINECQGQSEQLYGNSIILAFMLLKGLHYRHPQRDTLIDELCQFLISKEVKFHKSQKALIHQLTFDPFFYEKCNLILPDSLFFKQSAAAISAVFELDLPYPLIYDTNGVAARFIQEREAKNLETLMLEAGFEQKLSKAMIEGKAILVINPSPSIYKVLTPIISLRSQVSFENLRGNKSETAKQIKISTKLCPFNMDFRLYICTREVPHTFVKSMMTFISMDLMEPSSWKSYEYSRIVELVDNKDYLAKLKQYGNEINTKETSKNAEEELLRYIADDNFTDILADEQSLEAIYKKWKKAYTFDTEGFDKKNMTKSFDVRSPTAIYDKRVRTFEPPSENDAPIILMAELQGFLDELYGILKSIDILNGEFGCYSISSHIFSVLIDISIAEFQKEGELPGVDQLAANSGSIVYRIVVRICNSLPTNLRHRFLIYIMLNKYYETHKPDSKEFLSILQDININIVQEPKSHDNYHRLSEMLGKYPNLLPPDLTIDSSQIKFFLSNPLYRDSRLPHTVVMPHKLLLYSAFRPELISQLIPELLSETYGYRFIYIPPPVFKLVTSTDESTPNAYPIMISYEEENPIEMLKYECEEMSIPFEVIEPLMIGQIGKDKKDIAMKSNVRPIIQTLHQNSEMRKWIIIDNIQILNKIEVELLYTVIDEVMKNPGISPSFRLWILHEGSLENSPHLWLLFKNSLKLHFSALKSSQEKLIHWYMTSDQDYYIHFRDKVINKYHFHISSNPTATQALFSRASKYKKSSTKMLPSSLLFSKQIKNALAIIYPEIQQEGSKEAKNEQEIQSPELVHEKFKEALTFNFGVVYSALSLRAKFINKSEILPSRDMHIIVEKAISISIKHMQTTDFKDFVSFVSLNFGTFWNLDDNPYKVYALLNFLKHTISTEKKNLVFWLPNKSSLSYPLYHMEKIGHEGAIDALIDSTPSQDHLMFAGLPHVWYTDQEANNAKMVLQIIKPFLHTITAPVFGLDAAAVQTQKAAEAYKEAIRTIEELMAMIPEIPEIPLDNSGDFISIIEVYEKKDFNHITTIIKDNLEKIYFYLNYKTAKISKANWQILSDIINQKIPEEWSKKGPYCSRTHESSKDFLSHIFNRVKELNFKVPIIDLRSCYSPYRLLWLYLRHEAMKNKWNLYECCISAYIYDGAHDGLVVSGLSIHNALLEDGLIVNADNKELRFTLPPLLLKVMCSYESMPKGLTVYLASNSSNIPNTTEISRETRINSLAEALSKSIPYSKTKSKPTHHLWNQIFCPLFHEKLDCWFMFDSILPQSHWSKRALSVDI